MAKNKKDIKKARVKQTKEVQPIAEEVSVGLASTEGKNPYIGKEVRVTLPSGAAFLGLCIAERKTNSGPQVFLQLNGCVSRWFSTKDIKK